MSDPIKSTVGDTKRALSSVTGISPESIHHYAMVADTDEGTILKFCCDDRRAAAEMFLGAAGLVVSVRGEPLHPDGPVPAMPGDN